MGKASRVAALAVQLARKRKLQALKNKGRKATPRALRQWSSRALIEEVDALVAQAAKVAKVFIPNDSGDAFIEMVEATLRSELSRGRGRGLLQSGSTKDERIWWANKVHTAKVALFAERGGLSAAEAISRLAKYPSDLDYVSDMDAVRLAAWPERLDNPRAHALAQRYRLAVARGLVDRWNKKVGGN